jgi:hypothetical protein
VKVAVQAANAVTRTEIVRAVDTWKAAIDAYATATATPQIQQLHFVKDLTSPPSECEIHPQAGQAQRLLISTLGEVCLIPPDPTRAGPDIVITAVGPPPNQHTSPVTLGVAPGLWVPEWYVRNLGLELDPLDGSYKGVVLAVATTDGTPYDQYNVAAHEFAHAFAPGHVSEFGDIMYPAYHAGFGYYCFSTLNLEAVRQAYDWLGGPFQPPPTMISIPAADYGTFHCP